LPGNSIARHPPDIFRHAILADTEAAATRPAKWNSGPAAMAYRFPGEATAAFGGYFFSGSG